MSRRNDTRIFGDALEQKVSRVRVSRRHSKQEKGWHMVRIIFRFRDQGLALENEVRTWWPAVEGTDAKVAAGSKGAPGFIHTGRAASTELTYPAPFHLATDEAFVQRTCGL
jgi:hypothetical protein